jgi:acetyl-CoA synthetase
MTTEERQGHAIETMRLEERRYPPPPEFAAQANAKADIYDLDWEDFWRQEGLSRVTWSKPFGKLYEWNPP